MLIMKTKLTKGTQELRELVIALRNDGLSIREIAHTITMRTGWVGKIVQEMKASAEDGTPINPEPLSDTQMSKLASEILRRQQLAKPSQQLSVTDILNTRIGAVSVRDVIQSRQR